MKLTGSMNMAVFWVVAPCSLVAGTCCLHHQSDDLMMEVASTSETSVNFYQTIRRNNSEDSNLQDVNT
jgi:hypothetical protein